MKVILFSSKKAGEFIRKIGSAQGRAKKHS